MMRTGTPHASPPLIALGLLCVAAAACASTTASVEMHDVFRRGSGEYHTYRIPALAVTTSGTLLAFCEGRRNSAADQGDIDILLRRSRDGGRTWLDPQVVHGEEGDITIGNPVPITDRDTGVVWLVLCRNNRDVLVTSSRDDGATWAPPRDITRDVRARGWKGWYATGPGHGIQLRNGRLLAPANHRAYGRDDHGTTYVTTAVHAIYSDDHGATWRIGAAADTGTNEVSMAERSDGAVYMTARPERHNPQPGRRTSISRDGGRTWQPATPERSLAESVCQATVLATRDDKNNPLFLFSNPASHKRERMTLRLSGDEGRTWRHARLVYEGQSAYSDLCDLGNGQYGLIFEKDRYKSLAFVRFTLDWVRQSTPPGGSEL